MNARRWLDCGPLFGAVLSSAVPVLLRASPCPPLDRRSHVCVLQKGFPSSRLCPLAGWSLSWNRLALGSIRRALYAGALSTLAVSILCRPALAPSLRCAGQVDFVLRPVLRQSWFGDALRSLGYRFVFWKPLNAMAHQASPRPAEPSWCRETLQCITSFCFCEREFA